MSSIKALGSKELLASIEATINAPINQVWPYVGAIGAEKLYISGCKTSAIVSGHGTGAVRRVIFKDGSVFDERILNYDHESHRLEYEVLEPNAGPAKGVLAVLQLFEAGEKTIIDWAVGFDSIADEYREGVKSYGDQLYKDSVELLRKLCET